MSQSDLLGVDELQLWAGEPYVVNKYITIYQPSLHDIIYYPGGEAAYYSMVQNITAIPSDLKSSLWDSGIDWNQISDFQLFMLLSQSMPQERTKILLGDVDLQKLKPMENLQNGEIVLKAPDSDLVIDELAYKKITLYLCKAHNLTKKVENAANEFTKKFMIDEDRQKIEYSKKQPYKSFLLPLITSIKARQGYTKDYVLNMGLVEFMTEVTRLQIIVNTDALLGGAYSGMCDTSKIPKKNFNWLRSDDE